MFILFIPFCLFFSFLPANIAKNFLGAADFIEHLIADAFQNIEAATAKKNQKRNAGTSIQPAGSGDLGYAGGEKDTKRWYSYFFLLEELTKRAPAQFAKYLVRTIQIMWVCWSFQVPFILQN